MGDVEGILARPLGEQLLPPEQYVAGAPAGAQPATMSRLRNLIALERTQWILYHGWYRSTSDEALKVMFAEIARSEAQHEVALRSLMQRAEDPIEQAWLREQGLVDFIALLVQEEADEYVRAAFEYILLEIVEHSYTVGRLAPADARPSSVTPARRGRPMDVQNLAAFDAIKRPYLGGDPLTRARVQIATAVVRAAVEDCRIEVQQASSRDAKNLLAAIASVNESHLALLESLTEPQPSLIAQALGAEFTECTLYQRYLSQETDAAVKVVLRRHVSDETGHRVVWEEQLREREQRDPWPLTHSLQIPPARPLPVDDYLDALAKAQLTRRSKGKGYVEIGKVKEAFS